MLSMPRVVRITWYVLIVIVIAALLGLGWWYFFLSTEERALRAIDTARGIGITPPAFGGLFGSTYENIRANLPPLDRGSDSPDAQDNAPPRLWQITRTPVAGAGFMFREAGAPAPAAAGLTA